MKTELTRQVARQNIEDSIEKVVAKMYESGKSFKTISEYILLPEETVKAAYERHCEESL
jgi:hypothetical protein